NVGGVTEYSQASKFTTIVAPPSVPVLGLPLNGATNAPIHTTLVWNRSSVATSYQLQFSADSTFSTTVIDSIIVDTLFQTNSLQHDAKYYWRVRASNVGGVSDFSQMRNFTTIVAPPSVPVLGLPLNGATNVLITTTLVWNRSSGSTSYQLQFSTDSTFAVTVKDTTVVETVFQTNSLQHDTKYYWRVRASNLGGGSDYSSVMKFTTIIAPPSVPVLGLPLNGATNVPIH